VVFSSVYLWTEVEGREHRTLLHIIAIETGFRAVNDYMRARSQEIFDHMIEIKQFEENQNLLIFWTVRP